MGFNTVVQAIDNKTHDVLWEVSISSTHGKLGNTNTSERMPSCLLKQKVIPLIDEINIGDTITVNGNCGVILDK